MFETKGLLVFKFAKDWLPQLFRALRTHRTARMSEINKIADFFGDPVELARVYVQPDCQQFNPADDDEEEARYVVREPIFSRFQNFFSGRSLTGGNHLFVLADSGMGKTSALMMLKLAHIKSFWPKGYDCILLKLGPDTLDEIEKITSRRNKILLLDALDEDPTSWGRITSRITQILVATKNFRRVVITCRTQFFSGGEDPFNRRGQVQVGGFICAVVYLSFFTEEQIEEYCKKRFPKSEESLKLAKEMLTKMKFLRCRPMLLAHIEDLIQSDNKEWTEFFLYEALVEAWLQREHQKRFERKESSPPDVKELWSACRSLALELHKNDKKVIGAIDLKNFVRFDRLIRHISTMDIGGRSLLNKNSRDEFRFSHYSIQEFLVSEAIIKGFVVDLEVGQLRPTDQIISFILSWLSSQDSRTVSKAALSFLDLSKTQLSKCDLSWVNFQGGRCVHSYLAEIKLRDANLKLANFKYSNFQGADLEGAKLERASLENANFQDANLRRANLNSSILRKANLKGANLFETNFQAADLTGVDLRKTNLRESVLLKTKLRKSDLRNVDLQELDLRNFDLSSANLREANLKRTKLKGANLVGANLMGTNLKQSKFRGSILREAELKEIDLSGANLKGQDLESANLKKAKLEATNFMLANLRSTILDEARLQDANFQNACLENASLSGAILVGADLRGAILRGARIVDADLRNTDCEGTDFQQTILAGADFKGAKLENAKFEGGMYDRKTRWPSVFNPEAVGLRLVETKDKEH